MKSKKPGRRDVYRNFKPVRTLLIVAAAVLAVLLILAAWVFFGFQKYIVYTPDGLRLEVPWLAEPEEEAKDDGAFVAFVLPEE